MFDPTNCDIGAEKMLLTNVFSNQHQGLAGTIDSGGKVGPVSLSILEQSLTPRANSLELGPTLLVTLIQYVVEHIHQLLCKGLTITLSYIYSMDDIGTSLGRISIIPTLLSRTFKI